MKKNFFSFILAGAGAATMLLSCNDGAETTTTETKDTTTTVVEQPMTPKEEEGIMVGGAKMVASKNIVENASGSSEHTTLVTAVKAAGLVETLSGAGPFTVFAPTNAAFDKLPAGAVDGLLQPAKKDELAKLLTYHVVPGSVMAADLKDGQKIKTVQGGELTVSIKDGLVKINGATVTIPNVVSSNGVTHVIDAVLMPK